MNALWIWFRIWVKDSETIVWGRAQVLIGIIWAVLSVTDLTPLFTLLGWEKYLPLVLMAMGLITEAVRRSREPHNLGVTTADDLTTVMVPVTKDDEVSVNKKNNTVTITKAVAMPKNIVSKKSGDNL